MDAKELKAALVKIMPGYSWTVHRAPKGHTDIVATGIQASGFNRLSTVQVTHSSQKGRNGGDWFEVKYSGFGRRSPWLHENSDTTLASAFRGLQDYFQRMAGLYSGAASTIQNARKVNQPTGAAADVVAPGDI